MPLDYRGPGAKVLLFRKEGVRFTEDATIFRHYGSQEFKNQAIDLGPLLQSIKITLPIASETGMYRCEATLAAHYEDSVRLLNSFVSDAGNTLRVTLGYGGTGDQEKFFVGPLFFFIHWPGFDYGVQTQITLKGIGGGSNELARKVRTSIWSSTQLTLAQIIATVSSDHRLEVIFGKRPGKDGGAGTGQIPSKLSLRLTADYNQVHKSDQQLIGDLCRMGSCDYQIENSRLYVYDKDENREKPPVGTLVFFGQIDTAKNVWPITQFKVEGSMWFRPGGADQHQFRQGVDPRSGARLQPDNRDSSTADVAHDGDQVAAGQQFLATNNMKAFSDPGADTEVFGTTAVQLSYAFTMFNSQTTGEATPEPSGDPSRGKNDQAVRDNAQGAGFKATCETPGNPFLRAGQMIRVEGGGRLSGNYLINKVEHQLDSSGGFSTSLALHRNALGDDAARVTSGAVSGASATTSAPTAKRTTPARVPNQDGGDRRHVNPFKVNFVEPEGGVSGGFR